ncbi:VRR-NUC domain-containing protein [Roseivivax sp. CAU 1753]
MTKKSARQWRHSGNDPWSDVETAALRYLECEEQLILDRRSILATILDADIDLKRKGGICPRSMLYDTTNKFRYVQFASQEWASSVSGLIRNRAQDWEHVERVLSAVYGASKIAKSRFPFSLRFPEHRTMEAPPEKFVFELRATWLHFRDRLGDMADYTLEPTRIATRSACWRNAERLPPDEQLSIKRSIEHTDADWWLDPMHFVNSDAHGWIDLHLFGQDGRREMVEVKAPGDRLTGNQKKWLPLAKAKGWSTRVLTIDEN